MKICAVIGSVLCSLVLSGAAFGSGLDDDELVFELSARILVQGDATVETPSLLLQITNAGKTAKAFNVAYFPLEFRAEDAAGMSLEHTKKVMSLHLQRVFRELKLQPGESKTLVYPIAAVFQPAGSGPYTISFAGKTQVKTEKITGK